MSNKRNKYNTKGKESYQGGNYVMCGRKATYKHERVKIISKLYNQRFYKCPHCDFYHLTKRY